MKRHKRKLLSLLFPSYIVYETDEEKLEKINGLGKVLEDLKEEEE